MSDFQMLADTLLANAPALTLAIGTAIAIGLMVVIVIAIFAVQNTTAVNVSFLTLRADSVAASVLVLVSAALGALAMLLCVAVPSLWTFALGIFMVGMSAAVFGLARQSYLTEAVPIEFRARALSTLGGVMRIGLFIGPVVLAVGYELYWQWVRDTPLGAPSAEAEVVAAAT